MEGGDKAGKAEDRGKPDDGKTLEPSGGGREGEGMGEGVGDGGGPGLGEGPSLSPGASGAALSVATGRDWEDGVSDSSSLQQLGSPMEEGEAEGGAEGGRRKARPHSSTPSVPGLSAYPMSERQQLALLKQMEGTPKGEPSTPTNAATPQGTPASGSAKLRGKLPKVHRRNERGETPLHIAARKGERRLVRELLRAGADVNAVDYAGWTPLHESCNHGQPKTAQLLLRAGASVSSASSTNGDTPLHDAVASRSEALVLLLLRHAADPAATNKDSNRPADLTDHPPILSLLADFRPGDHPPPTPPCPADQLSDGSDDDDAAAASSASTPASRAPAAQDGKTKLRDGVLEPRRLQADFEQAAEENAKPKSPVDKPEAEPESRRGQCPTKTEAVSSEENPSSSEKTPGTSGVMETEEGEMGEEGKEEGREKAEEKGGESEEDEEDETLSLPPTGHSVVSEGSGVARSLEVGREERARSADGVEERRAASEAGLLSGAAKRPRGAGQISPGSVAARSKKRREAMQAKRRQDFAQQPTLKVKRRRLEGAKRGRPRGSVARAVGSRLGAGRGASKGPQRPASPSNVYDFHSSGSESEEGAKAQPIASALPSRKRELSESSLASKPELALGAEASSQQPAVQEAVPAESPTFSAPLAPAAGPQSTASGGGSRSGAESPAPSVSSAQRLPAKWAQKTPATPTTTDSSLLLPLEPIAVSDPTKGPLPIKEEPDAKDKVKREPEDPQKVPPLRIILSRDGSRAGSEETVAEGGAAGTTAAADGSDVKEEEGAGAKARMTRSRVREGGVLEADGGGWGEDPANHPHKRKQLKGMKTEAQSAGRSLLEGAARGGAGAAGSEAHWSAQSGADLSSLALLRQNSYEAQRSLRRLVEAEWEGSRRIPGSYRAPAAWDGFLCQRRTYLGGERATEGPKAQSPPGSLADAAELRELWARQELARVALRRAHRVQRERLILSSEREVLRAHSRATYADPAKPPLSLLQVLRSAELANPLELSAPLSAVRLEGSGAEGGGAEGGGTGRRRSLEEEVEGVLAKAAAQKRRLVCRQLAEAAALQAAQSLAWESLNSLWRERCALEAEAGRVGQAGQRAKVPSVQVLQDFDLLPPDPQPATL